MHLTPAEAPGASVGAIPETTATDQTQEGNITSGQCGGIGAPRLIPQGREVYVSLLSLISSSGVKISPLDGTFRWLFSSSPVQFLDLNGVLQSGPSAWSGAGPRCRPRVNP